MIIVTAGYRIAEVTRHASSHVAALVSSRMKGLKPFERTIEHTTEAMPHPHPAPKQHQLLQWRQIELQAYESCYTTGVQAPRYKES